MPEAATPAEVAAILPEQFNTRAQQEEAASLGIWAFLSTEILFFGGLMLAYTVYRLFYHPGFVEASQHLYFWIGTVNTFILLNSSLCMALAVHASEDGDNKALARFLVAAMVLGAIFLSLKTCEYALDYREHLVPAVNFEPGHFKYANAVELFLFLYFAMTGLHFVHMTIGLGLLGYLLVRARREEFSKEYHTPVRVIGLYWHFVDVVWVFLYPMLYFVGN